MNIIEIIKKAIKSRSEFKENLTESQQERLKVCHTCKYNSKNQVKKTVKVRIMIIINKLLDIIYGIDNDEENICTKCGCNLKHKTSQEEEKCPEELWK